MKDEAPASPKDAALRLALKALEKIHNHPKSFWNCMVERTAIKQALEETPRVSPEPEPVVWGVDWGKAGDSPCVSIIKRLPDGGIEVVAVEYGPKREPLTDEQLHALFDSPLTPTGLELARKIEAAHGIFANAQNKGEE
jgi:hypothetical protein